MGWSDWQDGFEFTEPGQWQNEVGAASSLPHYYVLNTTAGTAHVYSAVSDALADVPVKFADVESPTGLISQGSGTQGGSNHFGGGVDPLQVFVVDQQIPGGDYRIEIALAQWLATVMDPDYSGFQPVPPLPPVATDYEYETGPSTRTGWADWVLDRAHDNYGFEAFNVSGASVSTYWDDWQPYMSYRIVDPSVLDFATIYAAEVGGHDASGAYPPAMWPSGGLGIETARVTRALTTSGPQVSDGPDVMSMSVAGSVDKFTLLMQPSTLIEGPPALHDPTIGGGAGAFSTGAFDEYASTFGLFHPSPPKVRYLTPRWRYLIPDYIYTVGGHWADPNGVQVMRLKDDGVTWIPIVDGLAPPLR